MFGSMNFVISFVRLVTPTGISLRVRSMGGGIEHSGIHFHYRYFSLNAYVVQKVLDKNTFQTKSYFP